MKKTETMLKKDIPVIMSVGPNNNNDKISFYKLEDATPYNYTEIQKVNGHYFTVSGIIKNDITNSSMLHISTWGESMYINYKEYDTYARKTANNLANSSNILYIK